MRRPRKPARHVGVVLALCCAAGCAPEGPDAREALGPSHGVAAASVPAAKARWISTHQALDEIRRKPDVFLLCVADKEEYDRGHIVGSVLIPVRALRRFVERNTLWPEINKGRAPRKDQPIIVYCWWKPCDCPSIPTYSQLARTILLEKGFRDIAFINGGMRGWIKDNLPVEASPKGEADTASSGPARR